MKNKKEIISYLFFGLLTTAISILTFQLFGFLLGEKHYLINNIFSWVISVAFAFVTNKLWVFTSRSWDVKTVRPEIIGFVSARIFSLLLEEAGLFLLIDLLSFDVFNMVVLSFTVSGGLIAKTIMQFIVIVTNYFLSKFFIFKKG